MIARASLAGLLICASLLGGCDRPEDQETGSISEDAVRGARSSLPADVAAAIDSGNAAYRAEDYQAALRHYREAARRDESLAAAWFGIYMAELALGNVEEANRAIERARELAPGASLIHPETSDTMPQRR
jgi:tetratricopeptide (TPR) repeat protein